MAKTERILPHSRDAEQSVLGAAMLSRDALSDVMEIIRPDDFYDPAHKEIFAAMADLSREGENVDIVTVCDELKKRKSEYPSPFPFISDFMGEESPIRIKYGTQARPTCFLIGVDRVVRMKSEGLDIPLVKKHL